MLLKSVIKKKGIEFLALSPAQCIKMIEAYFKEGGNEEFESRAFDLFVEAPQKNPRVEKFRLSCDELLAKYAESKGPGQDYWQMPEGRQVLEELKHELRNT